MKGMWGPQMAHGPPVWEPWFRGNHWVALLGAKVCVILFFRLCSGCDLSVFTQCVNAVYFTTFGGRVPWGRVGAFDRSSCREWEESTRITFLRWWRRRRRRATRVPAWYSLVSDGNLHFSVTHNNHAIPAKTTIVVLDIWFISSLFPDRKEVRFWSDNIWICVLLLLFYGFFAGGREGYNREDSVSVQLS